MHPPLLLYSRPRSSLLSPTLFVLPCTPRGTPTAAARRASVTPRLHVERNTTLLPTPMLEGHARHPLPLPYTHSHIRFRRAHPSSTPIILILASPPPPIPGPSPASSRGCGKITSRVLMSVPWRGLRISLRREYYRASPISYTSSSACTHWQPPTSRALRASAGHHEEKGIEKASKWRGYRADTRWFVRCRNFNKGCGRYGRPCVSSTIAIALRASRIRRAADRVLHPGPSGGQRRLVLRTVPAARGSWLATSIFLCNSCLDTPISTSIWAILMRAVTCCCGFYSMEQLSNI
ncbi:hypothetical protein FB451DRAFT_1281182 [Mycena latifolia]|nr:hypothetical protein FB451DRAFT_1281182 [Mycena latifolia]